MASVFETTAVSENYVKIGDAPSVVIWNPHPTLVLRIAMDSEKPSNATKAYHTLGPRSSVEHNQIPDGHAVWVRTDRLGANMDCVWRQYAG